MNHDQCIGKWTLDRRVEDQKGKLLSHMEGLATWDQIDGGQYLYKEEVSNLFDGNVYLASQKYFYKFGTETLEIFLSDGELFASFPSQSILGSSFLFHCGEDEYEVTFLEFNSQKIIQKVEVSGPKKSYTIISTLVRA